MERTRAAQLAAVRRLGPEAEQLQNCLHRDHLPHGDDFDRPATRRDSGAWTVASHRLSVFMTRLPMTTSTLASFGDFQVAGFFYRLVASEHFVFASEG